MTIKTNNPKISVLMTVYNGEEFLAEAIESVLKQTFKNFEFIIVNDGSTDGSEKIIKDYIKKDERIVYLETKKNKGCDNLHNVINMGLDMSKGKYIARLDADDICFPKRLETQLNYLEKHLDIFMIGSAFEVIDKNGKKIELMKKRSYPSIFYKAYIGFSNSFCHSSIMFRNESLRYLSKEEHAFYFNLIMNGKKIKNISDVLVKYRINPAGMMAKHANLEKNPYRNLYKKN